MVFYLDEPIFESLVIERPRSVEENIRRGTNAIHRVMFSHSAELMAMFRTELGWISFEWVRLEKSHQISRIMQNSVNDRKPDASHLTKGGMESRICWQKETGKASTFSNSRDRKE